MTLDVYVITVCTNEKCVVSFVIMRGVLSECEKTVDNFSLNPIDGDVNNESGKER